MRHLPRVVLLVLAVGAAPASAAPKPPAWAEMLERAKGAFERHQEDVKLLKIVRAGEPRLSSRRTATELVPELFQDAEAVYETRRWHQVEKQKMTLHYESGLGGWTLVGFTWGDPEIVRPGKYPPAPPPPTAQEILDAVRSGMAEWGVRADDVEKVTPSGGGASSWLDDVPTAGYTVPVKIQVRDIVDRAAVYGARYKTRFVCDLKILLSLEDQVSWTMQGTVPDCADRGCKLARICKDTWAGGGAGGGGGGASSKPGKKR